MTEVYWRLEIRKRGVHDQWERGEGVEAVVVWPGVRLGAG